MRTGWFPLGVACVAACLNVPDAQDAETGGSTATSGGSLSGSPGTGNGTSAVMTSGTDASTGSPLTGSSSTADGGSTMGPQVQCGDGVPVAGELCFGPYEAIAALSRQFTIDAGDFDGDGVGDIVVSEFDVDQLQVHLGGPGGPVPGAQASATASFSVRVAQLAGGSGQDIAYVRQGGVGFMLGDGAGGFASPVEIGVGMTMFDLAAGDLNEDGVDDLVLADIDRDVADVLLADGAGGLTSGPPIALSPGLDGGSVVIADFDADGFADVAHLVSNTMTFQVEVRAGDGSATFAAPAIISALLNDNGIAAGDFDQDGASDLVILGSNTARVVFDPLDPAPQTVVLAAAAAFNATAGDIDGDGLDDLAVAQRLEDRVSVFASQGDRSFAVPVELVVVAGGQPNRVALADLDADGVVDIAAALAGIPPGEGPQIGLFFSDP